MVIHESLWSVIGTKIKLHLSYSRSNWQLNFLQVLSNRAPVLLLRPKSTTWSKQCQRRNVLIDCFKTQSIHRQKNNRTPTKKARITRRTRRGKRKQRRRGKRRGFLFQSGRGFPFTGAADDGAALCALCCWAPTAGCASWRTRGRRQPRRPQLVAERGDLLRQGAAGPRRRRRPLVVVVVGGGGGAPPVWGGGPESEGGEWRPCHDQGSNDGRNRRWGRFKYDEGESLLIHPFYFKNFKINHIFSSSNRLIRQILWKLIKIILLCAIAKNQI